jgi:predicted GH43/DUF377 family glycosyl hydrolase
MISDLPIRMSYYCKTYYGAADTQIACASVNISALVTELLSFTAKNEK